MTERPWDELLSARDREVIEAAGYDTRGASNWDTRGVGENPLLLIIDMQRIIVGENVSILEAVKKSRIATGEVAWSAMEHIGPFVETVRDLDIPVMYTRVIPPRYDDPSHPELQIIDALAPHPDDDVLDKTYASSFHGTDLVSRLIRRNIDTLVVVGNTTSGCLRATVVDAQQYGFKVLLPEECVFDRLDLSHRVGLLDMWMKYANVRPTAEVVDLLRDLTSES